MRWLLLLLAFLSLPAFLMLLGVTIWFGWGSLVAPIEATLVRLGVENVNQWRPWSWMRHAFPGGRTGRVDVTLTGIDDEDGITLINNWIAPSGTTPGTGYVSVSVSTSAGSCDGCRRPSPGFTTRSRSTAAGSRRPGPHPRRSAPWPTCANCPSPPRRTCATITPSGCSRSPWTTSRASTPPPERRANPRSSAIPRGTSRPGPS